MDIRFALQSQGIEWKKGNNDSEIRICCVFCVERGESQDYRFRLGINVEKGFCHCFNCGYKRRSFKELAYRLELGEVDNAVLLVEGKSTAKVRLPVDFEQIYFSKNSEDDDYWNRKARSYLQSRGLTRNQISDNNIGLSLIGRYGYRIIFPVYSSKDLEGFVARSFLPNARPPRYLNTPGIKSIYNLRKPSSRELVLSEGIVKCFRLENYERQFHRAFDSGSLLGHDITEYQESMIKERRYKVITLWPDPDSVGTEGFLKVADKLSSRYRVKIPWPLPKKQADKMTMEEIEKSFEGRRNFNEEVALRWQSEMMLKV